jgi:predicted nucleotidyltransferase
MDRFIEPAVRARIQAELDIIERKETVEVLLAVESGSRAWGFPSRDSDYDVRFIYVLPVQAYLAVTPPRDVIERPVDAVLDINGWDLRKALQLMLRSNAVLIEWLTSPVRYRDWHRANDLLALAHAAAGLTALTHHYQHQARRSFDTVCEGGETARLKSYCYAMRSALAVAWIRQRGEAPPMDVGTLMAGLTLPPELPGQFQDLIARKLVATEDAVTPRSATLDAFIADALSMPVSKPAAPARKETSTRADAFFAAQLLDRTATAGSSKAGSATSAGR